MKDSFVILGKAVMVAQLVLGIEIDFPRLLLDEIHEKEIRTSTTYQFPRMIF